MAPYSFEAQSRNAREGERSSKSARWTPLWLAGAAGGAALNAAMFATFRLLGFGLHGDGILLDPLRQSGKLIAVWTKLEPRPLIVTRPFAIGCGFFGVALVHALLYAGVRDAWRPQVRTRAAKFSGLLVSQFAFWEFFTPFNLFGEPLALVGLELLFWMVIATAEALAIVAVFESVLAGRRVQP